MPEPTGTVRWFAPEPWGAAICQEEPRIDIPLKESCGYCGKKFDAESEGVRLPLMGGALGEVFIFYHRECFTEMLGIGETGEHE